MKGKYVAVFFGAVVLITAAWYAYEYWRTRHWRPSVLTKIRALAEAWSVEPDKEARVKQYLESAEELFEQLAASTCRCGGALEHQEDCRYLEFAEVALSGLPVGEADPVHARALELERRIARCQLLGEELWRKLQEFHGADPPQVDDPREEIGRIRARMSALKTELVEAYRRKARVQKALRFTKFLETGYKRLGIRLGVSVFPGVMTWSLHGGIDGRLACRIAERG